MALTAAGLAAVLAALPAAHLALTFLGAGYPLLLGAQTLWQLRRAPSTVPAEPGRVVGGPAARALALLVLLRATPTLVWLGGCVFLLSKAWPVLHRPRVHRVLGRATGVVLTGFGLAVAGTAR